MIDYFDPVNARTSPFEQFTDWYGEIEKRGGENYNAVALSTSTGQGVVSSRIVLLKGFAESGFLFFTNYNSRKGREIASNPSAAMLFYWPVTRRQVRVEGIIIRADGEVSDRYFDSRPRGHKLNAMVSNQSSVIENRKTLEDGLSAIKARFPDADPCRPDYWGGFVLVPHYFEFWQEGKERFHDRVAYNATPEGWKLERLSP